MPVYKFNAKQHRLMCEALRRYECFSGKDGKPVVWRLPDIQVAWTGLGSRSLYQCLVDIGMMKPAITFNGHNAGPSQGQSGWWSLTELGAMVILEWHKAGFKCKDCELTSRPPMQSEPVVHRKARHIKETVCEKS